MQINDAVFWGMATCFSPVILFPVCDVAYSICWKDPAFKRLDIRGFMDKMWLDYPQVTRTLNHKFSVTNVIPGRHQHTITPKHIVNTTFFFL